jgi:hypothetical protein
MRSFKFAAAGVIAVSMIATTSAMAAQPLRSAGALPDAPMATNLRVATPLAHKSNQSDGGSPALGYVLAAVIAAGIVGGTVAAVSDDNHHHKTPSSPG